MSHLLRDIFDIPETSSTADYVLRLTESVDDAHLSRTLEDYVVTPKLAAAFDTALKVVSDSISQNTSKGAFLTGSFGSGKSHFMAVLYALLRQNPRARALPDLAGPISRHDPSLQNRKILPLTFHMLGAKSLEEALFEGYLKQVAELHPDATPPLLHHTSHLLATADNVRRKMGDEQFFGILNEGSEVQDVWSSVLGGSSTWDAASYEAARAASADDPRRAELVSALQEHYFGGAVRQDSHVGLDDGLTTISSHAHSLGYDAVVLFLDELVLWLAFRIRDVSFFSSEAQKITKLVEGGQGGRRIPLVSFIARQMDLRRWLADSGASGAEQQTLEQAFRFQEGRFPEIRLGDDNLPHVANKRLLTPKDDAARAAIDSAFANLDRQSESWNVLLDGFNTDESNRGADAAQFRLTYPFSPALVSTLRSLAGVMQRERTALKVMQQLLVDGRDTLTIDDVIPVGDAFDYLVTGAAGDQPLDEASAALFRSAYNLYRDRLLPVILSAYADVTVADVDAGKPLPKGLTGDLRMAKTLLLSAVAPNVPALKALTASRLASLNHGSIRSPLPGGEASSVLSKLRQWAPLVPEIRVEKDSINPLITVQLSDVDYESIVDRARGEDNDGRRRELIKRLVAEELGLAGLRAPDMFGAQAHQFVWRGSTREVDLVFGNVRDASWLTDEHFRARVGTWRFVIDHPFDEPGHSTAEDMARIDGMRVKNWDERTIVWLPRFFSEERMKDVSRLVILNYLLEGSGDRYSTYADHLSENGRVQAKAILQAQRESLLHNITTAIQVAYDVETPTRPGDVIGETSHPDVLHSLTPSFAPRPPAGGGLKQAFDALVQAAFTSTYPGHPRFEPGEQPVRVKELQVTYDYIERALSDPENRIPLDTEVAAVRRVANALGVARVSEANFMVGDQYFRWGAEFERRLGGRDSSGHVELRAGEVRGWLNDIEPKLGLASDVADLVVLAWAALRRRAWFHHGQPIDTPRPGAVRDEMELRVQEMPSEQEWSRATSLAGGLFGIAASPYMTPPEVARLASRVREKANSLSDPAHRLVSALDAAAGQLQLDGPIQRVSTARATADLCDSLRGLNGLPLIRRLASEEVGDANTAGRSLATAEVLTSRLSSFQWHRFDALRNASLGEGPRAEGAAAVLKRLREAFRADEFTIPLQPAMKQADDELFQWLQAGASPDVAAKEPAPPTPRPAASRRITLHGGRGVREVTDALQRFADEHSGADIVVEWRVE